MDLNEHPQFRRLCIPGPDARINAYITMGLSQALAAGDRRAAADWADALVLEEGLSAIGAQASLN